MPDKFNFDNFDIDNLDPDKIPLGTTQCDCSLIAQTFERAAHTIPSEAAIFSTITRQLQNHKTLTNTISKSLKSYDNDASIIERFTKKDESNPDRFAFDLESQKQPISATSFAEKFTKYAKDCIPCEFKLLTKGELNPSYELVTAYEKYINDLVARMEEITGLINNIDVYADFCSILDFIKFVCVPDLQRIISLLTSLFMFKATKLTGLFDILQSMIIPIFSPILINLTVLFDKFVFLVVNPLECILRALKVQREKLSFKYQRSENITFTNKVEATKFEKKLKASTQWLRDLDQEIREGVQFWQEKLQSYRLQIQTLIDEISGGDRAYIEAKLHMLSLVRMISLLVSVISAFKKGNMMCNPRTKTEEQEEIQKFFDNFMNPAGSFTFSIDDALKIRIEEKLPNYITNPPESNNSVKSNSFTYEGKSAVNSTQVSSNQNKITSPKQIVTGQQTGATAIEYKINELANKITAPVQVQLPCKFATSGSDIDEVNQWIAELNKV